MYETSFTNCPEDEDEDLRFYSQITYDDSFGKDFQKCLDSLDRFVFLIDMFRILDSCTNEFLNYKGPKEKNVWPDINRVLINYLNAAFSVKEYVNHYDPPLKKVTDKYYKNAKKYRFICDYRNSVIHQTVLIRDWSPKTKIRYIDKDALAKAQTKHLSEIIEKAKRDEEKNGNSNNQGSIDNAKRYLEVINSLECDPDIKEKTGKNLVDMKPIVCAAADEINEMQREVLEYAYKKDVVPNLEWLISKMVKNEGEYQYTFIYNPAYFESKDWEKYDARCFEPNCALESFVHDIFCALGREHPISIYLVRFLHNQGYEHIYDKHCTPEEFRQDPHGGFLEQDI